MASNFSFSQTNTFLTIGSEGTMHSQTFINTISIYTGQLASAIIIIITFRRFLDTNTLLATKSWIAFNTLSVDTG
jgi:hypothetical protein